MKRKLISATVMTALTMTSVTPAIAVPAEPTSITTRAGARISILVDDMEIYCDQPPVIVDGRTLVPLRAIFEALGATVDWNDDTRSVTATRGDTTILLTIGNTTMYRNGAPTEMDVPGQIINDRTVVPVRAVSESFGADVIWDNATCTVFVYSDAYPEDEQPSAEEQAKEVAYNAALLQLRNGFSHDAYYGFQSLGNYKDSAELMNQAYWLNQLCYNVSRLEYQEMYDMRENFSLLSESEIRQVLPNKTWLTPAMQSLGGNYLTFYPDGTGISPNPWISVSPSTIAWTVANSGIFYVTTSITDINGNIHYYNDPLITDGANHEFRYITKGVYADIDLIAHAVSGPGVLYNTSQFYVDYSSNIGQGLHAFWHRVMNSNWTISWQRDENGIYYEV